MDFTNEIKDWVAVDNKVRLYNEKIKEATDKFVTVQDLQKNYKLFVQNVQQQMAAWGDGGEVNLQYMDDITGIATIATLVGYSSEFSGAIGFSSDSTLVGAAITSINLIGGGATAFTSADNSTVNVTFPAAGASIGLAIALGG